MQNPALAPRTLSEAEAAEYIGLSRSTLRQGRCDGRRENRIPPPPYLKIGRKVAYLRDDLDRWLETCRIAL
jgi:predicted DNA-binding transcriptional regulator AlpA